MPGNEQISDLRAIATRLTTPALSGLVLTRPRMGALAGRLSLPIGFAERNQVAVNMLRAAVEMDCLRPLLEGLVAEVDRWDAIYAEWTERFPASAAIWDEWRARLATTKTLLSDMLEVAQEEGLN